MHLLFLPFIALINPMNHRPKMMSTRASVSKAFSRPRPGSLYSSVQPTVDSGFSVRKLEVLSNRLSSKRKSELFLRIDRATLAALLQASRPALASCLPNPSSPLHLPGKNRPFSASPGIVAAIDPCYLTLNAEFEFLLLDLRPEEEFLQCHIENAISFPATNLNKDKIHPIIIRMKNCEGKYIIVYAQSERGGVEAARQFGERNYSNVYLLSGGLEEFAGEYKEWVLGTVGKRRVVNTPKARNGKGNKYGS
jgi:rhodanese-related sulfurtransferase